MRGRLWARPARHTVERDPRAPNEEGVRWELAVALVTLAVGWLSVGIIRESSRDLDRSVARRQPVIDELLAARSALASGRQEAGSDVAASLASHLEQRTWQDIFPGRRVAVQASADGWLLALEPVATEDSARR